jgi:hypothetical protein
MTSGIEQLAEEGKTNISTLLYEEDIPIFGSVVIDVKEDEGLALKVPTVRRVDEEIVLSFSTGGAEHWIEELDSLAIDFNIAPDELYVTSGLALAELTIAALASLKGDADIRARVVKAEKTIGRSEGIDKLAKNLKELTEVPVEQITTAFNHEELVELNQLRYGIGLSLRAMGLRPKEISAFQHEARGNLGHILENYFQSTVKVLLGEKLPDQYVKPADYAGDVTARVMRLEPPVVEFAAASPMNMSYILGK